LKEKHSLRARFPCRIIWIYAFPENIHLFKLYWTATK
jgi:hypothetical protein